jgi:hypothetical protein
MCYYHELLALAESFLAQEDDGRLEHETHGVQFQSLFDFAQKVGNVEPFDASVVEQLGRTQIHRLLARFLMLTKQVIENGAVFFVNALHFVDMFGHLFHAFQGVCQMKTIQKFK